MKMKAQELYELRFLGRGLRAGDPLLTYVNLHKAPMTGISPAESLIMRNLTRFLWLGIGCPMGKKTYKGDNTISYQTLRYRKPPDTNFAAPAKSERSLHNSGIHFEIVERVKKRDDDIPSARDLQIFKLEREVAELKDDRKPGGVVRCLGRDMRAGHPLPDLTYVNSHKAALTATSVAE